MAAKFTLDSGKTQTFSATCDLSTALAISGGYEIDEDVLLVASEPAKNGWQVTLSNQTKARKTVTVYANCLVGSVGKLQATHVSQTVNGKSTATLKLGCQLAGSVVGGGFDLAKSSGLLVTESRLVGSEWVISVVNPGRTKQTFEGYAQCLAGTGLPALMTRDDSVKIAVGKNQVVEMKCETVSISGGYQAPAGLTVLASQPTAQGWNFEVKNNTRQQLIFKPQVMCVGSIDQSDQHMTKP